MPDFTLSDYLRAELIEPDLQASDKAGIIDELLQVLTRAGVLPDSAAAKAAVMAREESMSTGMAGGVAIPHGKTDSLHDLVCALGIKKQGLDFDSIDGQLSRIFVITLSPETNEGASDRHLKFMSTVSHILTPDVKDRVLSAATPTEILDLLIKASAE